MNPSELYQRDTILTYLGPFRRLRCLGQTSNRLQDGREVPNSTFEQKNKKDIKCQLFYNGRFCMSFKMTKVKLLFLYRFSVLSVHLHYKLHVLSRDGGRVRPHFYVLG